MQHDQPPEIYIGIDLGTTNSAIAYGGINRTNNRREAHIIKIPRKVDANTVDDHILLPSCQYHPKSGTPYVGDHAKTMHRKYPNRVATSTKCRMDKGGEDLGMDVPCTPIQVATSILEHLKHEASNQFNALNNFPEVVIAVPASFGQKRRSATLTAAQNTGFGITDKNLLEEPIAALHYFCNQKRLSDIEFNNSRILVFDLGGGTLDVSLHEVTKKGSSLKIDNIAVSPYKEFGGNQFDEKVADVLLNKYVNKYGNPAKTLDEADQLNGQFLFCAESVKIRLSDQINAIPHTPNPCWEINMPLSFEPGPPLSPFNYRLTWDEYEDIIEPFLAHYLSLASPYYSWRTDNIIDPILQVLDKAQRKLNCSKRPKVDIVLLNGGMTKLPVIEQRLKKLFGDIVHNDSDKADKAVALGAVYYQA